MNQMIFNGSLFPENESSHLYNNRGFLFGDGFFETMRMHEGRLLWKQLHSQRIDNSFKLLQLSPGPMLSIDHIEEQVRQLAADNGTGRNVRVRLSIFRAAAGYYQPETNACGYLLNIKPLESHYHLNPEGLDAGLYTEDQKHPGVYSGLKSLSAGFYVQAALFASRSKTQSLILCNTQGRLMEGLSSNLLLVEKDRVLAPPPSEGPVQGVMQKVVEQLCNEMGLTFKQEDIPLQRALEADEIWLSNVISGLQWVARFQGRSYGNKLQKEMARGIIAASLQCR
jgi:branched-chain amino acid aminotransferase